jgi:hypothetical protein
VVSMPGNGGVACRARSVPRRRGLVTGIGKA